MSVKSKECSCPVGAFKIGCGCRYVRSLSAQQLGGQNPGSANECSPKRILESKEGRQVNGTGLIVPCGLVAASYFNDTYAVEDANGPISINV